MPRNGTPLSNKARKAAKRGVNAPAKQGFPATIRVDGLAIDDDDRKYIRRRLVEKLTKHWKAIERVSVRLRDVNGPRGGVDMRCRIKVVLRSRPSVVVEHVASAFRPAVTRALAGAERAVRRALQRSRISAARVRH